MPEPRRSIQDIIPPARSHPLRSPPQSSPEKPPPPPPPPPTPPQPMRLEPERSGFMNVILVAAAILIVASIVIGAASTIFKRAYVTVTPFRFSAPVAESFQTTPESATLPYQKVEVTDTASKQVPAAGSQHVEDRASGTIMVYNSYSTQPQRLITNTRFETKDGLVYRVHTPIVIPGYTMKAGVKAPGTIDVLVYADQPGDTYNIDLTDFTLPGLKGSDSYDLIFARSKTPMTGGFIGEQATVEPALRAETVAALKADLDRSLREKMSLAVVSGSVVFNDSVVITYTEGPDMLEDGKATIVVSGVATAPAFKEDALIRTLATASASSYGGLLSIENPANIDVTVDPPGAIGADTPLTVTFSGVMQVVSTLNEEQLANNLAGKKKTEIDVVVAAYPGISDIEVKVYPFWLSTLPQDPAKIRVTIIGADAENL